MITRVAALLLLLLAVSGTEIAAATEPTNQAKPPVRASLPEIEDEVMCPVCGTLLGLSQAPAAQRQRVFIRRLINEGKTKEEIKEALVADYGGQVLAIPEDQGVDFWIYVVPVAGLGLGAIGLITAILVWRRRRPEDDDDPPASTPGDEASERLDRDIARFDL